MIEIEGKFGKLRAEHGVQRIGSHQGLSGNGFPIIEHKADEMRQIVGAGNQRARRTIPEFGCLDCLPAAIGLGDRSHSRCSRPECGPVHTKRLQQSALNGWRKRLATSHFDQAPQQAVVKIGILVPGLWRRGEVVALQLFLKN